MNYHSHSDPKISARFGDALLASLAPDGGLWMPDKIPHFSPETTAKMGALSFADCSAVLARDFVDDRFSNADLKSICRDAYDFPVPMTTLSGTILDAATPEIARDYILELFHGPTLAFKDFAARFMGRTASHLMTSSGDTRTILVATSGDTGGAIGDAFLDQEGINVFILFPKGGVSKIQEQQLCTMGDQNLNVRAISIDGTFDDCQQLVKDAFADKEMTKTYSLMSANSINVGRVIPQSFYYFWTSLQIKAAHPGVPIVYSIPSGNLGNLTGGLIAKKMGAPIERFVIGNNNNDPFVDYLKTGEYSPRPSVPTLSNAMDIGRPNNFPRILDLHGNDYEAVSEVCWGASFSDEETERHMRRIFTETGYVMCPHTTVGHLAMEAFAKDVDRDFVKVVVGTAHPAKFADSVERIIREDVPLPAPLQKAMRKTKRVHVMEPNLKSLDNYLAIHS
ncbi:threonine synthase [Hellea sp.]|nr:threonine synthase [Hellea sp.]